jgi:hypothetical protein
MTHSAKLNDLDVHYETLETQMTYSTKFKDLDMYFKNLRTWMTLPSLVAVVHFTPTWDSGARIARGG